MTYGVVACPSCRRARGFYLGVRTVQCALCGRRLDVTRVVVETAEDEAALAALLGAVNARLSGATPEEMELLATAQAGTVAEPTPPTDALAAVVRAARAVAAETDRVDAAARALSGHLGEFAERDLAEALETLGLPAARASAHLRRMLVAHVVYEPRAGVYKAL